MSPALHIDSLLSEPPGKPKNNTGMGSLCLLQGIFQAQELNWVLLHCRQILYQLSYQGSLLWIGKVHMEIMILMSPDSCIFPYIEKHYIEMSGFLQLTVIFACSDCLVFVAKSPMYPGSSLTSLEQSLRAICEVVF